LIFFDAGKFHKKNQKNQGIIGNYWEYQVWRVGAKGGYGVVAELVEARGYGVKSHGSRVTTLKI